MKTTTQKAATIVPNIIKQSNYRLKVAIIGARIDRNAATICEVRDAINARQSMRTRGLTEDEENSIAEHYSQQLRTYTAALKSGTDWPVSNSPPARYLARPDGSRYGSRFWQ